jgi:hypothetical protein
MNIKLAAFSPGTVQFPSLGLGTCGIVAAYAWTERLLTQSGPLYQRTK